MQQEDFSGRLETIERTVRNMRIAVIIIAAFFLYETITPSGLGKGDLRVMNKVKLKELIVLNDKNQEQMRLYADEEGGQLVLDDSNGTRLHVTGAGISVMLPANTGYIEQLRINGDGVNAYDREGRLVGTLR